MLLKSKILSLAYFLHEKYIKASLGVQRKTFIFRVIVKNNHTIMILSTFMKRYKNVYFSKLLKIFFPTSIWFLLKQFY